MAELPIDVSEFLIENCAKYSFCFGNNKDINDMRRTVFSAFKEKVVPYYADLRIAANLGIANFLLEPLKNAVFHGGGDVSLDLMMSPSALVSGCFDGGDYFTRSNIKRDWEARVKRDDKHVVSEKQIGFGVGVKLIYEVADLIYVDNPEGKLYVGVSINNQLFEDINS